MTWAEAYEAASAAMPKMEVKEGIFVKSKGDTCLDEKWELVVMRLVL